MIRIDKTHLIITNDLNQDYEILLSNLKTVDGLENWLCHMTEKNWFSILMAKKMAKMCEQHFGYAFNGKYSYD